jgi:protein required for attachment to host cells
MTNWLSPRLLGDIKRVFEPRYHRQLSDKEVAEIAENLTGIIEAILKFKWEQEYADKKVTA